MKKHLILFCFITAVIFFGCGKGKVSVTLAGSTAFQPFAEKIADEYMKANPNITITVQGGGSAVGIQSANSGAAQIGMADLVKLPDEAKELTSTIVAQDGIAVIVNPKNKIENLSTEQLRDVFNGKINNWKEIGGGDEPITVVSREAGSGTRSSFEKIVTGIKLVDKAVIQNSNGTIRETVANDENSIGYISHGILNEKVKGLKIDNVECTTESIIANNYKLVRPIFLLTKGTPAGEVKKFIDYILTDEIQLMIKKDGLLPAK
ncbi:MAG: phosphate ABC transporter substrate-binding protein [Ignavibacteriaceae bacterium]|nr:phosphate ABC transporter substrate-binding protein [Ignavibacteriaceae bacterium]